MTQTRKRPHPYQISDSTFEMTLFNHAYWVREMWWQVDRNGDTEDAEHLHGPYATADEAVAELERLRG